METRRVAVRTMVETVLQSGSLSRDASAKRMLEGTRGHQALQSLEEAGVTNEAPVSLTVCDDTLELTVYGRIDRLHDFSLVEEIKTTLYPMESETQTNPQHWAQVMCYAFFLCKKENLDEIDTCVTYLDLSSGEITRFTRHHTVEELEEAFYALFSVYKSRLLGEISHRKSLRNEIAKVKFPYAAYREGQYALASQVYMACREKKPLLCQAPTGTGKTMAVLFPALKAIGEGLTERLFYLTARTTQQTAAIDAVLLLNLHTLRTVVLSAREKSCVYDTPICKTGDCPRATGYYDRLSDAMNDYAQTGGLLTRERVRELADRYMLCPFELSLDLSLLCDVVICDYNYAFDPRVRLQRYFTQGRKKQTLLIDEAHNLPDRGRGMYSAALCRKTIVSVRQSIPKPLRKRPLYVALTALVKRLEECFSEEDAPHRMQELPTALVETAERCAALLSDEGEQADRALAGGLQLDLSAMVYIAGIYSAENYAILCDGAKSNRRVSLFCTDCAEALQGIYKKCMGAVLFSATLTPFSFYRNLCGLPEDAPVFSLPSPFSPEQLLVLHRTVSTRYRDRERTAEAIARSIKAFLESRENGNYLIYLPSYAYLHRIQDALTACCNDRIVLFAQQEDMQDEDRAAFLDRFSGAPTGVTAGLAVLGGAFAEGIDLPEERLSGAVIVGVGLPQLCLERDTLKAAYEEKYGDGYAYAYRYPGMGKVLQAAGRIVRTQNDRGVLLLLDDRYGTREYAALFPALWRVQRVWNDGEIESRCRAFWEGKALAECARMDYNKLHDI